MTIHEPIDVTKKEHDYFPKEFYWRGRRYIVESVEQVWTVTTRHFMGRVEKHGFNVKCHKSNYVLYHDVRTNNWILERTVK
jgi:hypothetical protein